MIPNVIEIAELLKDCICQIGNIEAYIFGSASRPFSTPNDIDIMIIYNQPEQPAAIRRLLKDVTYLPIHLLFLTIDEELETNFIKLQNCISIL